MQNHVANTLLSSKGSKNVPFHDYIKERFKIDQCQNFMITFSNK